MIFLLSKEWMSMRWICGVRVKSPLRRNSKNELQKSFLWTSQKVEQSSLKFYAWKISYLKTCLVLGFVRVSCHVKGRSEKKGWSKKESLIPRGWNYTNARKTWKKDIKVLRKLGKLSMNNVSLGWNPEFVANIEIDVDFFGIFLMIKPRAIINTKKIVTFFVNHPFSF